MKYLLLCLMLIGCSQHKTEYYSNGLIKTIVSPKSEIVNIEYNNSYKKISKIIQGNKIYHYNYNSNGLLDNAYDSLGKYVHLQYFNKGMISMIDDGKGNFIKILYDKKWDKPSMLELKGIGVLNVTYDNTGHVDKVYSPTGQETAIKISKIFSNLLDLAEPAQLNWLFKSEVHK